VTALRLAAVAAGVVALLTPAAAAPHPAVLALAGLGCVALAVACWPAAARWRAVAPACAVAALALAARPSATVATVGVVAVAVTAHLVLADAADQGTAAVLGVSLPRAAAGLGAAAAVMVAAGLPPLPWVLLGVVGLVAAAAAFRLVTAALRRPTAGSPPG
jgi:hypothetical protein